MSKTFTARPAVTRRGRGKMNPTANRAGRPPWNGSTDVGVSGQAPQQPLDQGQPDQESKEEQTATHQGGYTMITPNEKKRQQIAQQAQRGTKVYEDFKQQKKVTHVSYVGTVGGGCVTEFDARQKTIQNHNNAKFSRLQKQQKWKEDKKLKENAEYDKKKIEQRQKTESNFQRNQQDQRQLDDKHRVAMRRKNAAFLDRFEQQCHVNLQEDESQRPIKYGVYNTELAPKEDASGVTTDKYRSQQSVNRLDAHFSGEDETTPEYEYDDEPEFMNVAAGHQDQSADSLQTLSAMFPQKNRRHLQDVLSFANYDIEVAVDLLMK